MTKLIKIEVSTNWCGSEETFYYEIDEDVTEEQILGLCDELAYDNMIEDARMDFEDEEEETELFSDWEYVEETREEIERMGYRILSYR